MPIRSPHLALFVLLAISPARAQAPATPPGQYRNPVLFADYSDPDVIRHGNDFYLIASTFHYVPGIPILHSTDLVHWQITGHVLPRLTLDPAYDLTGPMRYGGGVWAPALRFHAGLFYIYFPTPDEGIFVTTAPSMSGPWTAPVAILPGPGYEDPCPFWDDDGTAWLIHSRKGAGPLILHRMSPDGLHLLGGPTDLGKTIVQDPVHLKTLEGPKLYKRNGWYYIFAPMGGVGTGSQAVLRSRSIEGPYDYRIVLSQGSTAINGPHQGAWVEGTDGRGWFLHFQKRDAHGRIVWLEPLHWQDDWPLIGEPIPGDTTGLGQPVMSYALPKIVPAAQHDTPQTSDTFASPILGQQWEWNHNPDDTRWSLTEHPGHLRLHPTQAADLLHARNTLTQTMQSENLVVTATLDISHMVDGDHTGLSAFDLHTTAIGIEQRPGQHTLFFTHDSQYEPGPTLPPGVQTIQLRAEVHANTATYSYSLDRGHTFQPLGPPVTLVFSWWKGARPALFAFNPTTPSSGYVDFDQVTVQPVP